MLYLRSSDWTRGFQDVFRLTIFHKILATRFGYLYSLDLVFKGTEPMFCVQRSLHWSRFLWPRSVLGSLRLEGTHVFVSSFVSLLLACLFSRYIWHLHKTRWSKTRPNKYNPRKHQQTNLFNKIAARKRTTYQLQYIKRAQVNLRQADERRQVSENERTLKIINSITEIDCFH